MHQRCLIPPEAIAPSSRYEKLFENLPKIRSKSSRRGRPPIAREALQEKCVNSMMPNNIRYQKAIFGKPYLPKHWCIRDPV